jgi:hypothetical protein
MNMNNTVNPEELNNFYQSLIQDLKSEQVSGEDGGILEQLFTQTAVDLLAEAGETENVRLAYDEKALGTRNQHKINAHSIADNYETVDLFITIFKATEQPEKIAKDEVDTAAKRITNFFRKSVYKDYVNDIEESASVFDFVHTLSNSAELKENLVRVNAIIICSGIYQGSVIGNQVVCGYTLFYRVVDLEYLFNITKKSHIPIVIDFEQVGFEVPCIMSPSENPEYQSYLAIVPGRALAAIYEKYGSRLLEQNVRSFLQFTGKINKGIRNTILKEPHMFLAFNNGLAATAESVEFLMSEGKNLRIKSVQDFQIVNGGQTTASLYHTLKKDKADISGVHVQLKLSVIKNKEYFSDIVSRISEYANTQNKVSVADLSSNRPFHIELEKLSRSVYTPYIAGQTSQTRWFYERARGQYKNERLKEGFSKTKLKAFDLRNPKNQVFSKEELAKYVNAYNEVYDGKKLVVGPHMVVRGNQKNYVQFIGHNTTLVPDNVYLENVVAKAILFRAAEKIYGIKPNAIGDLRYITVPYSISWFTWKTGGKLDLYKIWRTQDVSYPLKSLLYRLMVEIEIRIRDSAEKKHGALYGEWAKKEDCWTYLKNQEIDIDLNPIRADLEDPDNPVIRRRTSDEENENIQKQQEIEKLRSVPSAIWHDIEEWGRASGELTDFKQNIAYQLSGKIKENKKLTDAERQNGIAILEAVLQKVPELLYKIDELAEKNSNDPGLPAITMELIHKVVQWDKKNKRLRDFEYVFMSELAEGKRALTQKNTEIAKLNLIKVRQYGFND